MIPTEEQIKELWEWCGFKLDLDAGTYFIPPRLKWVSPLDQWFDYSPKIDLNNLFKWAVPKIKSLFEITFRKTTEGYQCLIHRKPSYGDDVVWGEGTSEALALFWAIWKVIKE